MIKFFGQLFQTIYFAGSATGYEQPPKPTSTYDNTGYNTDSYGHNHYGTYLMIPKGQIKSE